MSFPGHHGEKLAAACPCEFHLRIWPSIMRDYSTEQLLELYRNFASYSPHVITFALDRLDQEPKITALLALARKLQED